MVAKMLTKSIKIMLVPNNKQKTRLFQYAGASRFAYNWTLARQKENYRNGGKFIQDNELRKEFTQLKKMDEYSWINNISNNVTKQAIKDACNAYTRFFNGYSKPPRFKSKKKSKLSFYQDSFKIKFTSTHVKLEGISRSKKKNKQKLNWVRLSERDRIPTDCKCKNPRISFDGLNWFVSLSIEYEDSTNTPTRDGIGIDLGIKNLAICSDSNIYKNINKTKEIKKLEKKKRRLQRKISKKYLLNKKGGSYVKTCNIIKSERDFLKLSRRLTNIRQNYSHQITTEIIKRNPSFISVENLNVKNMMKNRCLSKAIQQQSFYEFKRQIKYKATYNNIKFIEIDRWYPSSKTCSECGCIKSDLKLSDREFICPNCGIVLDRDYNASINIRNYGQSMI